jgi:hypothetical protein
LQLRIADISTLAVAGISSWTGQCLVFPKQPIRHAIDQVGYWTQMFAHLYSQGYDRITPGFHIVLLLLEDAVIYLHQIKWHYDE